MTTKKILVTIPENDANWLEKHPEINKSGLFKAVVSHLREQKKTVLFDGDLEKLEKEIMEA